MSYKEPGVYLWQKNNPKYITGSTPSLIPVIMGSGATKFKKSAIITRGNTASENLPSTTVSEVLSIGNLKGSSDYVATTDYTIENNVISWVVDGSSPPEGSSYYVEYAAGPETDQYDPKLIFSLQELRDIYGDVFKYEDDTINPVFLGASLAFESGTKMLYVIQVDGSTAAKYVDSLTANVQFIEDAYRIIPMDLNVEINSAMISHVKDMSLPEERKERKTMFGAVHSSSNFTEVRTSVGGYAKNFAEERLNVIYPDVATKRLSDGKVYDLGAPYICAAIAGLEGSQPVERSLTRSVLTNFIELKGVSMLRKQKNLLAEDGVMILEQPGGPGTSISIRHGLTTDMSTVQTRENSIIAIKDYCSKYIRKGLEPYIGVENITPDLVVRMRASVETLLSNLKDSNKIIRGEIVEIFQDPDNPDTIIMEVIIFPPYPCNYVKITLFLD